MTTSLSTHPPTSPQSPKFHEPLVYYASYGSNIDASRFACYIQGGKPRHSKSAYKGARNKQFDPEMSHYIVFENELMFGGPSEQFESSTWGGGGVCFVAPMKQEEILEEALDEGAQLEAPLVKNVQKKNDSPSIGKPKHGIVHRVLQIDENGKVHIEYTHEEGTKRIEREFDQLSKTSTIGRMYKVTWDQFLDTVMQENGIMEDFHLFEGRSYEEILEELTRTGEVVLHEHGMYGKMMLLGFHEDCPILTFTHTSKHQMVRKAPSLAYASTIGRGLTGIPGMTTKHARDYLHHKHEHGHSVGDMEKYIRAGDEEHDDH